MKLQDAQGVVIHLAEFLADQKEPRAATARTVRPLFAELGEALAAEDRTADAAKARKAALFCEGIADGASAAPDDEWCWVLATAAALRAVVCDGAAHEDAGYPEAVEGGGPDGGASAMADAEIFSEFISRQSEQLEELESMILAIESGGFDGDVDPMMRYFHTLKGESALLGLDEISKYAHAVEDMLADAPCGDCSERLIGVKDWLEQGFLHLLGEGEKPEPVVEAIGRLAAADEAAGDVQGPQASRAVTFADVGVDEAAFATDVREGDVEMLREFVAESWEHLEGAEAELLTLESDPRNEDSLNAVFRAFHTIKGVAGFIEMPHVQTLAHKAENLLDLARKGEIELTGAAMDLTFESVDMLQKLAGDIGAAVMDDGVLSQREELPGLLDRLMRRCDGEDVAATASAGPAVEPEAPGPGRIDDEPAVANVETVDVPATKTTGFIPLKPRKARAKPAEPKAGAEGPDAARSAKAKTVKALATGRVQRKDAVRVDADRLDRLVEMIGELVIAEAMVSQYPGLRSEAAVDLARNLDHLDKICRELQEIGMSLRMVHVRPVFQKMARLVRDLSHKCGREIEFTMSGEETELDKSVVEKIGDPLVHMIRNAVDHGIESDPRERIAKGKPAAGRIHLRAFHKGGNIVIEVEDDGKGLDKDVILAKAVERGVVKEGQNLSDREIHNLIFEPGFSTAKQVTDVSGRGVGMDVVRRNTEELRGSVEIDSVPGEGSTFRFKLPLTLAIIDGMVISVGAENYIIPTLSVVRLVRPRPDELSTVRDRGEMLRFEDELIPLFRLHRLFDVAEGCSSVEDAVVVVVESDGRRIGLMTDSLLGQQQIVIKGLGEKVQGTPGIAGGAIMSDGNVALILDVAGLVKVAQSAGLHGAELENEDA